MVTNVANTCSGFVCKSLILTSILHMYNKIVLDLALLCLMTKNDFYSLLQQI